MASSANVEAPLGLAAAEDLVPSQAGGPRTERGRRPGGGALSSLQAATGAVFLLPNLVLVTLFLLVPLAMTFYYSFTSLDRFGRSQYVGINNFADLLSDPHFRESMWNTLVFTFFTVPVPMVIGLALALLLNSVLPGRAVYRTAIFLPLVISGVATGVLGTFLFDENNGFVNRLLADLGFTGPHWQSQGSWAMTSIIVMTVWQRVGFAMIIYLAGLQGVSPELLEAAELDGASAWQRLRRITVPLLGPSTFFLLIMNIIYSFQVFDMVWAMTVGGPGYSTTTALVDAYRQAFDDHGPGLLGYGAAIGVVIYLITLLITGLQWRFSRTRDETG
jgi:multiple sugar transport system permease protein